MKTAGSKCGTEDARQFRRGCTLQTLREVALLRLAPAVNVQACAELAAVRPPDPRTSAATVPRAVHSSAEVASSRRPPRTARSAAATSCPRPEEAWPEATAGWVRSSCSKTVKHGGEGGVAPGRRLASAPGPLDAA